MPTEPLVSVVIPTYNRAALVTEAIDSVLAQNRDDVEVIVVDDGSTDETPEILRAYGPRIRVITQDNAGRSSARNAGWSVARGNFLSFLDSDDLWEPWHVDQLAREVAEQPTQLVYSAPVVLWDPRDGRTIPADRRLAIRPGDQREAALLGTVFPLPGLFVPAKLCKDVGGFAASLLGSEDWAFLVALTRAAAVVTLPTASVRVRVHSGRSMSDIDWDVHWRMAAAAYLLRTLEASISPRECALISAGSHRYCAARLYEAGRMREARNALSNARAAIGPRRGWRIGWRLWLQTWAGPVAARARRWRKR